MKKNEEKKFKKLEKQYNDDSNDLRNLVKVIIIVVVSFAILYFLGGLVTGKIKLFKDKKEAVSIQYTEILAEQVFKQDAKTYYVLCFDSKDSSSSMFNLVYNKLASENSVFIVDLNKKINSTFIVDNNKSINKNPKNVNELKIKNPTLIKVSNDKVKEFIVGLDSIKKFALK